MAILFDLDGVFYQGDQAIDGAAEVASWVQSNNIPHLYVTNTSSRPRNTLVNKLAKFGIQTDESHILTPPVATARWLKQHSEIKTISLFMPEATQIEFADFKVCHTDDKATDAVIIGDLGEDWNFQKLNHAFRQLMQSPKPQLIALGMTRYWRAEDGLRLDVAPFIVALEHASDTKALVMGKPAQPFYLAAIDLLKTSADKVIMIGDDIKGDIEGAQIAGMQAALVKTGKFRSTDLQLGIQPTVILDSVSDLPDWYQQHPHLFN